MSQSESRFTQKLTKANGTTISLAKKLEVRFERLFFSTRWFVVPIYVGLSGALVVVMLKFVQMLLRVIETCWGMDFDEVSVGILDLIDFALLANLLLIVMFAGYENFVSRLDLRDHSDFPRWIGHVTFGDIKVKLMASIVAMSAIHLLADFVRVGTLSNRTLSWSVGIHMAFVISGVLMAVMDRVAHHPEEEAAAEEHAADAQAHQEPGHAPGHAPENANIRPEPIVCVENIQT